MIRELYVSGCNNQPLYEVDVRVSSNACVMKIGNFIDRAFDLNPQTEEWLVSQVGLRSHDYTRMFTRDWNAAWCVNVGQTYAFFQFRNKDDAVMFKLAWGGV